MLSSWFADGHLPLESSHGLSSMWASKEGERAISGVSFLMRALIPSGQGPTLMTSFNLISLETPLQNVATLEVRASACVFVGDINMQPTHL